MGETPTEISIGAMSEVTEMASPSSATNQTRWSAMVVAVAMGFVTASAFAPAAHADMYGFLCITNNSAVDAAIGEAQLFVEVTDQGTNDQGDNVVRFTFTNTGAGASSITDVYYDDGALLELVQLIDADDGTGGDAGVDFSEGANPADLPGGELLDPPFHVTSGFAADSDSPPPANGVNPGEWLGIEYTLEAGKNFSDVIAQLNDDTLRIGIHVQDFDGGGSEGFVHVPAPGAAALGLAGIGMVGWLKRRYV